MLEKIIAQTLKHRSFVLLGVLVLIAFGVYSYLNLPVDAFPDVTNVQVEILSTAPGLSALEIERFVTYPIENAMRGLPDVVQMRSITKFGLSVVTIVFKDNVDIYFARQLVFQRLEEATSSVPRSVTVSMGPIATAMGEIPIHAAGTPMPSTRRQETAPGRLAHASRVGGDATAEERAWRERDQFLRRIFQAVPGYG
jgi:cobalt-zinc-cadmium resistance protein CzcA